MARRDPNSPVTYSEIMQDFLEEEAELERKAAHLKPKNKKLAAPEWTRSLGQSAGTVERTGVDPTTVDGQPRSKR